MKKLLILFSFITFLSCQSQEKMVPYDWNTDLHQRLLTDFCRTEAQVKEYVSRYIPDVTDEMMRKWEASKALEYMVLDGEKHYFRRAGPNLFLIDPVCRAIKAKEGGVQLSGSEKINQRLIPSIIESVCQTGKPMAMPKRMRITYTLTVDSNVTPADEIIRCWLPYPRRDQARQQSVRLLQTSEKEYLISPDSCKHSTIYMEKKAQQGKPTVFSETFEYYSYAEWHSLDSVKIMPYDTASPLYKEYTAERETHILFTPRIKALADSLTQGLTSPLDKARALFVWVNDNFPWASAREYSTIENIPEYVLENGHGDCGQVSLLFITLCRYCGIPAHFQSGFMMHPGYWNLHDWAEVYFEGFGWVPVDQSFGIPTFAKNDTERMFFLGGIDPWRMIVNSDYSMPLVPLKKYPRSETVDFQRGEVEWAGGNIYFPGWNYDMGIQYLD